MEATTVLSNYDRPITYFGVAYTLIKEASDRLNSIDKTIQERLKDITYFAPDGSRHITIMNLTHVAEGYRDKDVIRFFEENGESYKTRLRSIVSKLDPFEVRFPIFKLVPVLLFYAAKTRGKLQ